MYYNPPATEAPRMRRLLPAIAFVLVLAMPAAAQKSAVPISPGTQQLSVSITAVFAV